MQYTRNCGASKGHIWSKHGRSHKRVAAVRGRAQTVHGTSASSSTHLAATLGALRLTWLPPCRLFYVAMLQYQSDFYMLTFAFLTRHVGAAPGCLPRCPAFHLTASMTGRVFYIAISTMTLQNIHLEAAPGCHPGRHLALCCFTCTKHNSNNSIFRF